MMDTPQRDNLNATPKQLPDAFVMQKGSMTASVSCGPMHSAGNADSSPVEKCSQRKSAALIRRSRRSGNGDSLVTRTPVRDGSAPYVLTTVTRLEGATLVIQVTQTSEATGAVRNPYTVRYSK